MVKERKSMILLVGAVVMMLCCAGCVEPGVQDEIILKVSVPTGTDVSSGHAVCFDPANIDGDSQCIELSFDEETGVWVGEYPLERTGPYRVVTVLFDGEGKTVSYHLDSLEVDGSHHLEVIPVAGHTVGEDLPEGGGHVFCEQDDRDHARTGWRYLCCSADDWHTSGQDPAAPWRYGDIHTGLTSAGVGFGAYNCLALSTFREEPDSASGICCAYDCGSCEDWFLPSIGELQLLYDYLQDAGESSISLHEGFYWSSTEEDAEHACCLEFDPEGERASGPKLLSGMIRIRPVRYL